MTSRSNHDQPAQQQEASEPSGFSSTTTTDPDRANRVGTDQGDGDGRDAEAEKGEKPYPPDPWQLNPERMPRSITLELPELLLAELLALAERQGRCLSEIATELIAAQLNQAPFR